MKQLHWTSKETAQAYCHDRAEFEQALAEVGLAPIPASGLPTKVTLPSGLILHARQEQTGSRRIVVTIAARELW